MGWWISFKRRSRSPTCWTSKSRIFSTALHLEQALCSHNNFEFIKASFSTSTVKNVWLCPRKTANCMSQGTFSRSQICDPDDKACHSKVICGRGVSDLCPQIIITMLCVNVCLNAWMPQCLNACMHGCMSASLYGCLSVCLPVCVYVCMYACILLHCIALYCIVVYGTVWYCMVLYGSLLQSIAVYCSVLYCSCSVL